jgi:hypothetical protein
MKRTLAILVCLSLTGCAFSARTVGQHDPTVEAIKALTEVLKAQATPSPTPTPTPEVTR